MAQIAWGRPTVAVCPLTTGGKWKMMPTIVQNSTTMNVEKGEKTEALCEGGEVEDVKYDRNKFSLVMTIRMKKGRTLPIPQTDGYVADDYAIALAPEDAGVPGGIVMQKAHVSAEVNYSSEEGTTVIYTFDALVPDSSSSEQAQVVIGQVTIADAGGTVTVKVKPLNDTLASTDKTVAAATGIIS